MILRFGCSFLAATTEFEANAWMMGIARAVRFPALVGCTITVVIWWSVLVPLIDYFLRGNAKHRGAFWKFNKSAVLVNIHGLNLPLCALEFLWTNRPLVYFDLWMGMTFAIVYLLWYLVLLDANGVHFYIILSPRPHLCFLVYTAVLGIYLGLYYGYAWLLETTHA